MAAGSNHTRGRSSNASKPYDVSNSFVKRVASRVTELLPQPSSWFSRWMSPTAVPNPNDFIGRSLSSTITSRPPATSRSELNLVDNVDHHAPAPKKPRTNRYNSPVNQNKFLRNEGYSAEDISPIAVRGAEPVAGPSSRDTRPELVASTPAVPVPQISTKVNGDDCSETSESTSGCSSLVPQAQSSSRSLGGSRYGRSVPTGSSLDALDRRRPSFNTTTFNSPLRASMRARMGTSPFYSGRTMYGGSSQSCDYATMMGARHAPQRRIGPTVRPPPSQQQSQPLSSTAKRILDSIEQFSTPVIDAKRMPVVGTKRKFDSASQQRYTELNIPSMPDLLRVKRRERLQQSTLDARQTATTAAPPVTPEYTIRKEDTDRRKHTGKVKRKENLEEETVEEVKLPAAVLPLKNLPKIDIAIPPPPTALDTPKQPAAVSAGSSKFVFSAPTVVSGVITPVSIPTSTFKFSAPLGGANNEFSVSASEGNKQTISSSASSFTRTSTDEFSSNVKRQVSKSDNSLLGEVSLTKCSEGQKAPSVDVSTDVKSFVSSIDCKYPKENISTDDKTVTTTQKGECSNCKNNNSSPFMCNSCRDSNSKLLDTTKNNIKTPVSSGFGNLYKKPAGLWECSTCLIQNKSEATKCIACESPKPVPKNTTVKKDNLIFDNPDATKVISAEPLKSVLKSSDIGINESSTETKPAGSGFGNLFKKPAGSWACDICMVNNDADKVKCVACENPKPGATIPKALESSVPKFSFGIPSAVPTSSSGVGATFNFGIPKSDQSSNSTLNASLAVPKTTSDSAAAPVSQPTFSFGIPTPIKSENNSSNAVTSSTNKTPSFQLNTSSAQVSSQETKPLITNTSATSDGFGNLAKKSVAGTSKVVESEKPAPATSASSAGTKPITQVLSGNSEKPSVPITAPALFTFGNKITGCESEKSNETSSISKATQPTFMFGAKQGDYGSSMPSSTTNTLSCSSPSNVIKFGDTKTVSSGSDMSSISSISTQASIMTAKPNNVFSFGTNTEKKITFGAMPAKETPVTENKPTFGSFGAAANTPATFGSNTFGNKEQQPNPFVPQTTVGMFGSTSSNTTSGFGQANIFQPPSQENKPSPVFSFGASVPQKDTAPGGGFVFNPVVITPSQPQPNAAQLFGFNNASSTAPASSTTFNFEPKQFSSAAPTISPFNATTSGPTSVFGASAPQQAPAFGGQPTPAPVFNFGSQTAQQPQAPANPIFEFGSNQQQTACPAPAPAPAPTFVFGATPANPPAFDPNIKPTFNFTQGANAPVFSAIPTVNSTGPAQPQNRKIRKAVRRTNISSVRN